MSNSHFKRSFHTKALAAVALAVIVAGCSHKATPREQKLADCTTDEFAFRVTWPTGELFQVVLGVPYADTNELSFRGELVFRHATRTVARVPVGSHDVTACNWLDNSKDSPRVAGYILTWSRTNAAERLDNLFTTGQTYDVEVRFGEPPPRTSTLWLHWIAQIQH